MFFFNDTATTEICTLSLHDALPIFERDEARLAARGRPGRGDRDRPVGLEPPGEPVQRRGAHQRGRGEEQREPASRSEEHTSELQSRQYLVCRLLLEKKKITTTLYQN